MTQSIRAAVQALMNKWVGNSTTTDLMTLAQGINSNDAEITSIENQLPTYIYKAVVSQAGTAEPIADSILINTFPATPTFSYLSSGSYSLTFTGFNTGNFVYNTIQCSLVTSTGLKGSIKVEYAGSGVFSIDTYNVSDVAADDLMASFTIVIEAYPL